MTAPSVLAVIPARGGSKGVPRKNIRLLGGRPLIAWTIAAAFQSARITRVVVSTDDPEIAEVAAALGADTPFIRPAELAGDKAPGDAPLRHAVAQLPGHDVAVLLQPTSPFRTFEDIDRCLALVEPTRSVVSVSEVSKHPAWMFTLSEDGMSAILPDWVQVARRQDLPAVYALNGAVYAISCDALAAGESLVGPNSKAYVMPAERSIDIDTEADLAFAETVARSLTGA